MKEALIKDYLDKQIAASERKCTYTIKEDYGIYRVDVVGDIEIVDDDTEMCGGLFYFGEIKGNIDLNIPNVTSISQFPYRAKGISIRFGGNTLDGVAFTADDIEFYSCRNLKTTQGCYLRANDFIEFLWNENLEEITGNIVSTNGLVQGSKCLKYIDGEFQCLSFLDCKELNLKIGGSAKKLSLYYTVKSTIDIDDCKVENIKRYHCIDTDIKGADYHTPRISIEIDDK